MGLKGKKSVESRVVVAVREGGGGGRKGSEGKQGGKAGVKRSSKKKMANFFCLNSALGELIMEQNYSAITKHQQFPSFHVRDGERVRERERESLHCGGLDRKEKNAAHLWLQVVRMHRCKSLFLLMQKK